MIGSGRRLYLLGFESRMAVSRVNVVIALRAFLRIDGGEFSTDTFGCGRMICLGLDPDSVSFDNIGTVCE